MVCQRCRGLLVRDAFYDLSVKADAHYATTRYAASIVDTSRMPSFVPIVSAFR